MMSFLTQHTKQMLKSCPNIIALKMCKIWIPYTDDTGTDTIHSSVQSNPEWILPMEFLALTFFCWWFFIVVVVPVYLVYFVKNVCDYVLFFCLNFVCKSVCMWLYFIDSSELWWIRWWRQCLRRDNQKCVCLKVWNKWQQINHHQQQEKVTSTLKFIYMQLHQRAYSRTQTHLKNADKMMHIVVNVNFYDGK